MEERHFLLWVPGLPSSVAPSCHCSTLSVDSRSGPKVGTSPLGLSSPGLALPFTCDLVSWVVPVALFRVLRVSTWGSGLVQF